MPESIDDFIKRVEADTEGARLLSPRDYAARRKMAPQLVYYYIRNNSEFQDLVQKCECGRMCIVVEAADEFFEARDKAKPK